VAAHEQVLIANRGARGSPTPGSGALRILYLDVKPGFPPRSGGEIRSACLLRCLGRHGRITVLSDGVGRVDPAALARFQQDTRVDWIGVEAPPATQRSEPGYLGRVLAAREPWALAQFGSPAFLSRLLELEPEQFDLIFVRYVHLFQYLWEVPRLRPLLAKTLVNLDDVGVRMQARANAELPWGYERLRRSVYLAFAWRVHRRLRHARGCLVASEQDRRYVAKHFARRVSLVPNVFDLSEDVEDSERASEPELLFCGRLDYPPNENGLAYFYAEIWPRILTSCPNATLRVVGSSPSASVRALEGRAGISLDADVPSTVPFYRRATLTIVPLRTGAGTRIKILEAMALGCPVVSTTIGAEGLDIVPGEHLRIADSPEAFAAACLELLRDAKLRASLTDAARKLAHERYALPAMQAALDGCLEQLGWSSRQAQ
jgi:glycosyltransferase involved in cell wall biosynthesis